MCSSLSFIVYVTGASNDPSLPGDIAVLCLERAISKFQDQEEFAKQLATMIFPLLLVIPKVP